MLFSLPLMAADADALFKELAVKGTSDTRRDELVGELSAKSFAEVGAPAIAMAVAHADNHTMYNTSTKKPWMEQLPEKARICFAAIGIWKEVVARAPAGSLAEPLAEMSLSGASEGARASALGALCERHYDPSVRPTLIRLAEDPSAASPYIAVEAANFLFHKEDADSHLSSLLKALDRIEAPSDRSMSFYYAVSGGYPNGFVERLSGPRLKEAVRYGFSLLEKIDDGQSGTGFFLAGGLGYLAKLEDGGRSFYPDQKLPKYQGEGMHPAFDQDTVNNARIWWNEHRGEYAAGE